MFSPSLPDYIRFCVIRQTILSGRIDPAPLCSCFSALQENFPEKSLPVFRPTLTSSSSSTMDLTLGIHRAACLHKIATFLAKMGWICEVFLLLITQPPGCPSQKRPFSNIFSCSNFPQHCGTEQKARISPSFLPKRVIMSAEGRMGCKERVEAQNGGATSSSQVCEDKRM